jgi:hypothetical protein
LAEIDELRNRLAIQAFDMAMNDARPISSRTNRSTTCFSSWTEASPSHAGLAAALRRAFAPPEDEAARQFEELIRQLN